MIFENCIAVLEISWRQHGSQNSICKHWFKRLKGFPSCASGKEPACQCRRHKRYGFNPWVEKIPWRRDRPLEFLAWAWEATVHSITESNMTEAT